MTISAKVIADSISEAGIRITSLQLRYPRFIHAEFMTHRVFSRNASSSRAVPVNKLIEDIIEDTAMPIHWGKNQPGMQAHEECNNGIISYDNKKSYEEGNFSIIQNREQAWNYARDKAIASAEAFNKAGYHKQIVNRLLEPFSHINVIVTATEWDNFFNLRCHPDAQPEIRELATKIRTERNLSVPHLLLKDDWHLPYVTQEDKHTVLRDCNRDIICSYSKNKELTYNDVLIRCSVARCARVSYLTHDMKTPDIESDLKLYERLVGSKPIHASPAEHQATPDIFVKGDILSDIRPKYNYWENQNLHGNFNGWIQYRKKLEHDLN